MQIAPTTSYTPAQSLAPSQSVADVLPKNGEAAVDALFSPVEQMTESSQLQAYRQAPSPVVYDKPTVKSQESQETEQDDLSEEDSKLLEELRARDQEVRTHEQAHKAMGGQHAGAASYTFQQGPDGNRYAVGGEVPIDLSEVSDDPEATVEKMQQIQRAALAPNEPSGQDRQVAAQAGQKAAQAINEIAVKEREQKQEQQAALKEQREKVEQEKLKAKKEQEKADKKVEENEQASAAERMAQYNFRMTRINETLLRLSMPPEVNAGQILNAQA